MPAAQDPADVSRLIALGVAVRDHLLRSRDLENDARATGEQAGDTIFALDRKVEPVVLAVLGRWPATRLPLLLVAEGFGDDGRVVIGGPGEPRFALLLDPIDGTRGLMMDKRAAWSLAAMAPLRDDGSAHLADALAAAMVEIPASKQTLADVFGATAAGRLLAWRENLQTGARAPLTVKPSTARTLEHGFGHVASFFPGTKALAADLMEHIAAAAFGHDAPGFAPVFDDQYLSTGGQMVELIAGHDRFCCDLRPFFDRIVRAKAGGSGTTGLHCHPYDVAGALVARQAGVLITDGLGRPLDAPFDVFAGVHWCGYANEAIRVLVEPAIHQWLRNHGVSV